MFSTIESFQYCGIPIHYSHVEVEYTGQGERKGMDFEDSGKAIKVFGAKRPRLMV